MNAPTAINAANNSPSSKPQTPTNSGPSPATAKETSPLNTKNRDNPFDAFRKVVNHEANQDDDGGFFTQLGGLEPDPEDDGPTAKGLFQHMHRDKGGTPVRASYADNTGTGWNATKGRSAGPHLQWEHNTPG